MPEISPDPEVFMVEELPPDIDIRLAEEIRSRDGRVIQKHGKPLAFLRIPRLDRLFAKIKPRTDVEGESI